MLTDDNILRNVNQTAGQITRVSGTECRICQTFTCATGRNKVFQNIQTFTIICTNRNFDCRTGSIGNQSTHSGKLTKLCNRTTCAGMCHHLNRVVRIHIFLERISYIICCLVPCLHNKLRLFSRRNITVVIHFCNFINFLISSSKNFFLLRRNRRITNSRCNTGLCRILKSQSLDFVQYFRSCCCTVNLDTSVNNFR